MDNDGGHGDGSGYIEVNSQSPSMNNDDGWGG